MVRKIITSILLVSIIGCSNENQSLKIDFNTDSTKIVVTNIKEAELFELKKMVPHAIPCGDILCVIETPTEGDSTGKEQERHGDIHFEGDSLVFVPKVPFKNGQQYMVETIIGSNFATTKDAFKGDIGHVVKTKSATLTR